MKCVVISKQWLTALEDCGCKLPGVALPLWVVGNSHHHQEQTPYWGIVICTSLPMHLRPALDVGFTKLPVRFAILPYR